MANTPGMDERIAAAVANGDIFDFRPAQIIEHLQLKRPQGWSYRQTAQQGHFGNPDFPWERTDKADALRQAFQL